MGRKWYPRSFSTKSGWHTLNLLLPSIFLMTNIHLITRTNFLRACLFARDWIPRNRIFTRHIPKSGQNWRNKLKIYKWHQIIPPSMENELRGVINIYQTVILVNQILEKLVSHLHLHNSTLSSSPLTSLIILCCNAFYHEF